MLQIQQDGESSFVEVSPTQFIESHQELDAEVNRDLLREEADNPILQVDLMSA